MIFTSWVPLKEQLLQKVPHVGTNTQETLRSYLAPLVDRETFGPLYLPDFLCPRVDLGTSSLRHRVASGKDPTTSSSTPTGRAEVKAPKGTDVRPPEAIAAEHQPIAP